MALSRYSDLLANVRWDRTHHSIRSLVQPDDPEVLEVASVLSQADNFVAACQDFVDSFTTYEKEIGDYWDTPAELLHDRAGDCDDKAILLASLLRYKIPPEQVFCAVGTWTHGGKTEGHMWVVMDSYAEEDHIVEATAHSRMPVRGVYKLQALFNDKYAFSYPEGLRHFDLIPSREAIYA